MREKEEVFKYLHNNSCLDFFPHSHVVWYFYSTVWCLNKGEIINNIFIEPFDNWIGTYSTYSNHNARISFLDLKIIIGILNQ